MKIRVRDTARLTFIVLRNKARTYNSKKETVLVPLGNQGGCASTS
jgi:hypothetical protein